jgi:hypothetical protein
MSLLPTYRNTNGEYERFKEVVNSDHLLNGNDNEFTVNNDEAYELAQSLWIEVMSSMEEKTEDAIFSFIEYLQLIQLCASGFVFKLASADSIESISPKKNLCGVLWQTATMRRNFELYGGYIWMDMMKRGINTLLWPYFAVAMYDEMKKLCIGCKGLLCGERDDIYQFATDFLA